MIEALAKTAPMLILIVDDTEATRYSVARVLKNDGFKIIEASTGAEGLKLANEHLPDLTILDIHLPDIMGFEVCRRLKAAARTAAMPVLQISASYVSAKDRVTGLEGGADTYLTHPVEPQVLIATVRALLRMRDLNRKVTVNDDRLSMALRAAPITLFELDRDLRYKWVHGNREHLSRRDVIGRRMDEIYESPDVAALLLEQKRVIQTGEPSRAIFRVSVEGAERIFDIRMEPAFADGSESGEITGLICAGVDVTEREIAKAETERARDAAESANRTKSQFIANVSHEIRTPLGVIMGFSDLIMDSAADSREENMRSVAVIKRNAVQLLKLIDEVLDLSKVEADRMEIELLRFDLVDVLDDVTSLLALRARESGVTLSTSFVGEVPAFLKSDPTRLRQVLINLLGNALKFTERGQVKLVVSTAAELSEGAPVTVHFDVEDSGIGISKEQASKLFSAFSQADASTSRRFGGTGLGLMLSRKLAEAMGGSLKLLRSEPGQGSTFRFTLTDPNFRGPTVETNKAQRELRVPASFAQAAPAQRVLEGLKILLVEDSPDNQVMIQRFLTQAGASVWLASNGLEGVARAGAGSHDVILMDIQMPVMDGYEAARSLRAQNVKLPIIALTAHALKGEREKCLEAGFSDYLTKPVNRQTLIKKIQEACS